MPAKSISTIASELSHASDAGAALALVHEELASADRSTGVALLHYDARRQALVNRALIEQVSEGGSARSLSAAPDHALLALDHLPPAVGYVVLAGQRFADVGDQAVQYAQLLGVAAAPVELRLLLKGIIVEGTLIAVLALYDTRRRTSGKLIERAEPLAALFELGFVRLYEREARFEAVAALHDVTSRMRAEHVSALGALERELERLRSAQRAGTSEVVRELRDAVARAEADASAADERLNAVEGQVVSAVERLERLHVQLAEQDVVIRADRATIRELRQRLAAIDAASDPVADPARDSAGARS